MLYLGVLSALLWLLGNFIHLMKSHDFSTYPQFHVRINTHLRIDAFMVVLGSLFFFAFPDAAIRQLVSNSNEALSVAHPVTECCPQNNR